MKLSVKFTLLIYQECTFDESTCEVSFIELALFESNLSFAFEWSSIDKSPSDLCLCCLHGCLEQLMQMLHSLNVTVK